MVRIFIPLSARMTGWVSQLSGPAPVPQLALHDSFHPGSNIWDFLLPPPFAPGEKRTLTSPKYSATPMTSLHLAPTFAITLLLIPFRNN